MQFPDPLSLWGLRQLPASRVWGADLGAPGQLGAGWWRASGSQSRTKMPALKSRSLGALTEVSLSLLSPLSSAVISGRLPRGRYEHGL